MIDDTQSLVRTKWLLDDRGTAAVEFGFIAVLLLGLLVPAADLGIGIYRKVQVQNASQAGAQYAMINGFSPSGITGAVKAATRYSGISATPDPVQFCACSNSTGVTTASCGSTCSGGVTAGTYVTVSAQSEYQTIIPYPNLPPQFTFLSKATVRIK